jgi:putative membrane protein
VVFFPEASGVGVLVAAEVMAGSVEEAGASAAVERRGVGKMINAETFFTAEEEERIRQVVVTAEQRTAGEIVPMLVGASARYAEIEIAGMGVGLVAGTLASFVFQDPWASIHSQLLWPLAGAALGSILCAIPAVKRNLIPKGRITEAVHLRSLAAFTAQGLHYTRAHTGILILASLLEHRVEVLADKGINEKVPAGTWNEVVQILTVGLNSGNACDAFCKAIERCGEILSQHFPRPPDDQDELANKLVIER